MTSLMLTGNQKGLIMVGRTVPTSKKVEPVQPVEKVDNKFNYYYNMYIKREDSIMERLNETNFKAVLEAAERLLNEAEKGKTSMDKVRKEIISIGNTIEFLRNDLPKILSLSRRHNLFAKVARELEVVRNEMIQYVNEENTRAQKQLAKNVMDGRSIECPNCHNIAGFNPAEWWSYEKDCPFCGHKIIEQ